MPEPEATVLVIDDNDAERYYVSRVLQGAGFETREGANGAEALRMALDHPDLITLDVRLPDLSGFEVCRRLKADPATRDIPVLHVSASFTTPGAKAEGLDWGADGYLTHPVDPVELVATVRALLRAQRAEERVRAVAREWAATFDLISDAVCLTGASGEVVRCNLAFARLLGRPFGEIVGRPLPELVPDLAPLADSPTGGTLEVAVGERHFRVISGVRTDAESGVPTRAWVLGDITDRRRGEQSLRESEERARARLAEIEAIYDVAPVGLCVIDRDLRFTRINRQLAAINGLPVEGHLGRTVREVLPALADVLEPRIQEVFETGQSLIGMELQGETPAMPDEERVWLQSLVPLRGGDGRVTGINIAVEDVTERRRSQEALQQAQRLEAVGRLAGGVAHETNNQMTVVLGCANFMLREAIIPEEIRDDLEQIRKAAERTASITAQLLAFGRRQFTRPEVVDLNAVLGRLEPILDRAIGPLSSLRLERGSGIPAARVDAGQFDQVLVNLALNARDAMPDGGTLTIRTSTVRVGEANGSRFGVEEVPPGAYVRVTVSDTGHGMDDATLARAFEPFFTTKGIGQGTGLGLSMAYGIVKQNGGYISVSSAQGQGTTFTIHLPAAEPEPGTAPPAAAPAPSRKTRTVLVVEDDPEVRAVLVRELSAYGFRTLEAPDGRTALELVKRLQGRLDAVVSDVQMPEMTGGALAERLAVLQPGLPVLLMSGYPDADPTGEVATRGRAFIQKPFTGQQLAVRLEEMLRVG